MKIVFINYNSSHRNIYYVNLDGSDLIPLTDNNGKKACPIWSPDGNKIAFLARASWEEGFQIYVMDSNGKNTIRLTEPSEEAWSISWSKDGKKILYSSRNKKKIRHISNKL